MQHSDKTQILQQIATIGDMERGKLSSYTFKDRPNGGNYYKLQHWENGKNQTRYVTPEELPAVQSALEGYAQYQRLTEQYANLVIEETRQKNAGSKKKKSHRISSLPKRKKSKT